MRILVVNYEYPPIGGGGGIVTRDILECLAGKGHDITVLTSLFRNLEREAVVNGVRVIRVPVSARRDAEVASIASMLSFFPASLWGARRFASGRCFDIVNTHFAIPSGPSGFLLARRLGLPNVLSIHGGDIFDPSKTLSPHTTPVLRHTVRNMLLWAQTIVAQSTDTMANARKYYNIHRPMEIIPLGIKKPAFARSTPRHFNIREDETVFCTVGRLVKRKNIGETIAVLGRLKNRFRFKFFIIGEGPQRRWLENLIQTLGLDDRVVLTGFVPESTKFQLLDLSDCYLSTSDHEGFGLVFLEAMACGLPIISYDRGGQKDFLIHEKTGFLVERGDREDFGQKIRLLSGHPELCRKMAAFNRSYVQNYFIDHCARKYLSLFKRCICSHQARQAR